MNFLVDHIVLNCTDVEKEVEFYHTVFGFPPERLEPYRAGKVPFPSVRINSDTIIDLFPATMWNESTSQATKATNLNHFCLTLCKEEFSKFLEKLDKLGIEIEQGPVARWGSHGTGISVYFHDPEHNLIEVRYYENGAVTGECLLGT